MPSSSNNNLHSSMCKRLRRNLCLFLGVCGISIGLFTFCLLNQNGFPKADQGKSRWINNLSEENAVVSWCSTKQSKKNESSVLTKSEPPPEQVFAEFNQWVAKFIKLKKSEHPKGKDISSTQEKQELSKKGSIFYAR